MCDTYSLADPRAKQEGPSNSIRCACSRTLQRGGELPSPGEPLLDESVLMSHGEIEMIKTKVYIRQRWARCLVTLRRG